MEVQVLLVAPKMIVMKKMNKEEKRTKLELITRHVEKHFVLTVVILSLIILASIAFAIFWHFDPTEYSSEALDYAYFGTEIAHIIFASIVLVFVILNHIGKFKTTHLVMVFHVYALYAMAWATFLCVCDLSIGLSPIIYLLIATAIAGLLVIEPFFFLGITITSFLVIVVFQIIRNYPFFSGINYAENAANFLMFFALILVIAFRRFSAITTMEKATMQLEKLAHYDELTGLLNERSYVKETENINNRIKEGKNKGFAVVLMDVNNLKVTNDAFGHRYGCHLIVRCGHTLPLIFKTSKLFHVGGDEFIAIVYDEDFEHFEEKMKTFDELLRYSLIEYDGHQLIFSVARGFAIHQEGQEFKDVLQIADDAMYANKAEIKKTYNMKSRDALK